MQFQRKAGQQSPTPPLSALAHSLSCGVIKGHQYKILIKFGTVGVVIFVPCRYLVRDGRENVV